ILITDTRKVWTEVITSSQLARRWRVVNRTSQSFEQLPQSEEDAWREARLELLDRAHSLGAFPELSFEVVPTRFSDLAVRIETESFSWVWEATFVGYRMSAELISQQLILPLISVTHLALGGQENTAEAADGDLEKALDKVARSARRTPDTHVRNAIAKPRTATCLRRMGAMLAFLPDPLRDAEKPDLTLPDDELPRDSLREGPPRRAPPSSERDASPPPAKQFPPRSTRREASPPPRRMASKATDKAPDPSPHRTPTPPPPAKTSDVPEEGSVTESSTDDDDAPPARKAVGSGSKGKAPAARSPSADPKPAPRHISPLSSSPSPPPSMKATLASSGKPVSNVRPSSGGRAPTASRPGGGSKPQGQGSKPASKMRVASSDSDSPPPPPKRARTSSSSEDEQPRRGARQPLRRGRKRF
ncbi:hypothetical protein HDZ31DRAFT_47552, partial [Schizophyllum fasciatum]